jgi:membrane protease YdiL (CAAX protease family)
MISERDQYPKPRAIALVVILVIFLIITIGSWVQLSEFPGFLSGMYITEWLLILCPPIFFLKKRKMNLKRTLSLEKLRAKHLSIGILCGLVGFFVFSIILVIMENIIGPYPEEFIKPIMEAFPKNWLGFIPWIFGIAFSAGICEEVLFRGFVQNGLEKSWGTKKALIVSSIIFGVFHLDPWRSPAAILLGLVAGYLLLKTRSLLTPIAFHISTNSIGQILTFLNYGASTSEMILVINYGSLSFFHTCISLIYAVIPPSTIIVVPVI